MKCDRFIGTGNTSSLGRVVSDSKMKSASTLLFAADSQSTIEVSTGNHAYGSNLICHGINTSIRSTNYVRGLERRQFSRYSAKNSILNEDYSTFFCDNEESKKPA